MLASLFLILLAIPSAQAQTASYALRDLGTLPGQSSSVAWGINASGEVVGWSGISPTHAFIYSDGSGMVELAGLPGHTYTVARGINNAGVVVGGGWGPGIQEQALRWTAGAPQALGMLDGTSESWDINGSGAAVGSSPIPGNFVTHAFVHTDAGGMVDIAPSSSATAYDVNDLGEVTGSTGGGAFIWSPATGMQVLGSLPDFPFGHGRAVNNAGQVAGFAISATGIASRIFRYTPGVGLVNLGGSGEDNAAWGMNTQGDVVGEGRPGGGLKRAFVYTDAGGLRALNELIDASPRWFLLSATDINDAGQIVGYGFDNVTGQQRAYRLDPIPRTDVRGTPGARALELAPAAPNPGSDGSRIVLTLERRQTVSIGIYDIAGHRVALLHEGPLDPGPHPFELRLQALRSGIYFVHARGETRSVSRRFTVLR